MSRRLCRELGLIALLCLSALRASAQPTAALEPPTATPLPPPRPPGEVHASYLLQVDSVLYHQAAVDQLDPGSGAPLNEERFLIRRARARVDGRYGYARGLLQVDANTIRGPAVRLLAAELSIAYPVDLTPPIIEGALGLFLIPFGFETIEPAAGRMFLESSTWVRALFPGRRDLGARLSGAWSFARYALAVMNGNPSASAAFPLRDPNRAKDFVGRLGAEGELLRGVVGRAGVSGLIGTGFHPGMPPTKDDLVVRDANEDGIVQPSEVQLVPGDPGEPAQTFSRFAVGADVGFGFTLPWLGKGQLYGEVVLAENLDRGLYASDPIALGRDTRQLGAMGGLRQDLTRHAELGVRYDHYDPDRDATSRQALRIVPNDAAFKTLAVAIAWCTVEHVRVTVEYDHQENALGRNASGAPTTLASDSLTLRGQLEL